MASINKHKNGIVIRWDKDDWIGGLAPTYGAGLDTRPANGLNFATAIDPYRRFGFLCPGYTADDATNASSISALLKNGVSNGTKAYCIEAGTKLHEVTVATVTPSVTASGGVFPHTITAHGGHTTVVGSDVVLYALNGTKYLFYSWNDNTDGDIGRYNLDATFDDDYVSTTATSGAVLDKDYPHPMIVGDDNILYIGNGNNLASLQGTTSDGIFNASALDLPDNYIITSFAKDPNYLVIYAYRGSGTTSGLRGEATAFFWDMVSPSYTYAVTLPGNYVNGGFNDTDGVPSCFVFGRSVDNVIAKQSKMIQVGYIGTNLVVDFDDNIPGHGGVEVSGNTIFWNSEGNIFSYGVPFKGFDKALQKTLKGDGSTSEGMLRNFLGTSLTSSSGTGTSGGLNYYRTGFSESAQTYTGQVQLPQGTGEVAWQIDFIKVNYYAKIDDIGTRFDLAVDSDGSNSSPEQRGQIMYVYESDSAGPATIDKISKIYRTTSGVSTTGSFPVIYSSLGVFMTWNGGAGTTTSDAPCIEFIEIYLTPITNNTT